MSLSQPWHHAPTLGVITAALSLSSPSVKGELDSVLPRSQVYQLLLCALGQLA